MVSGENASKLSEYVRKNGHLYLLTILVCVSLYFKSLFYGITNSDDEVLITGNLPFLRNLSNIFKVFTTDAFYLVKSIDLYRPLQSATFIIDAQLGANTVFSAHLTNLVLHILSCLAVFHLLKMLGFRRRIAGFGALVYATHYLFMTAVAWIPARGDLLLALFSFLTVITFIRFLDTSSNRYYLLHCICFALAVFSKESAVVLPLILAAYVWSYSKLSLLTRKAILLPVYYAVVHICYFVLKSMSVTTYAGDVGFSSFVRNIRSFPEMVARFYVPVNVSTMPDYRLSATVTGLLLLAGLALVHFLARGKKNRRVLFAVAWFLLFIIPGMTYFPVFYYFAFEHVDHRAYVTCFGLLVINLNLIQCFDLDTRNYSRLAAVVVLIYLASVNLYFNGDYKDASTYAVRAIKTNPKSAQAYSNYGRELYAQGRDDEALDNLNRSIRLVRKFMPALHTRALIYRKRGMNREALADLDTLLAADPEYDSDVYCLRGFIKNDLKDFNGAMADFTAALRLNPNQPEAFNALQELKRAVRGSTPF